MHRHMRVCDLVQSAPRDEEELLEEERLTMLPIKKWSGLNAIAEISRKWFKFQDFQQLQVVQITPASLCPDRRVLWSGSVSMTLTQSLLQFLS